MSRTYIITKRIYTFYRRSQRISTMSSTSKKHSNIVSEPMRGKPVQALPGVGPVLGRRLESSGYQRVSYGLFMLNLLFNVKVITIRYSLSLIFTIC